MVRDFRFSFNIFGIPSREALRDVCRRAESAGFDTVFAADHLGAPATFPVPVAAADATVRMRVGTLVSVATLHHRPRQRGPLALPPQAARPTVQLGWLERYLASAAAVPSTSA